MGTVARDGSNLYLIWSAWFDLKIYLVPSFAWFCLIWRFKYLGLIWLEQFENCKCLTWLGLVFKYLKKAWAWSFDFLKGLIWLEKYKPESNLQPRIIITEKLWIFYFCILLDVILRSICNFNATFFQLRSIEIRFFEKKVQATWQVKSNSLSLTWFDSKIKILKMLDLTWLETQDIWAWLGLKIL